MTITLRIYNQKENCKHVAVGAEKKEKKKEKDVGQNNLLNYRELSAELQCSVASKGRPLA
jgi:hypothetical protein